MFPGGWGGYMGPKPEPESVEDCDAKPLELSVPIVDHESGARNAMMVQAMPRKLRGNLLLLKYLYETHPERVR